MEFVNLNSTHNLGFREFSVKIQQFPVVGCLFTTIVVFLSSSLACHRLEADIRYMAIVLPVTLIVVCMKLHRIVIKESVLILPSLGVQLRQTSALGTQTGIRFVPISIIKSVFINETIRKQHVITYLTLLLTIPDNRGKLLVPLFRETLPKLEFITKVYRDIHKVLLAFN